MKHIKLALLVLLALISLQPLLAEEAKQEKPKVLFLLAKGFNTGEFYSPYAALKAAGYHIDIAGIEKGIVYRSLKGEKDKRNRDAYANLSIKDIKNIDEYAALVIPGGYSPGFLEKEEDAKRIARLFFEKNKPVGAVCHGPRLLMQAGLLKDRIATGLFNLPDELADQWVAGEQGKYVDKGVVIDGELITARFPLDMDEFSYKLLKKLAKNGGIPMANPATEIILVGTNFDPHARWTIRAGFKAINIDFKLIQSLQDVDKHLADENYSVPDALFFVPGKDLKETDGIKKLVADTKAAGKTVLSFNGATDQLESLKLEDHKLASESYIDWLNTFYNKGIEAAKGKPAIVKEAPTYNAVLAVREGFDGEALAMFKAFLRHQGYNMIVMGPKKGWATSANGLPVKVEASYDDEVKLAENTLIIMPGSFWPQKNVKARQTEQPAWIEEQAKRDTKRIKWVMDHYNAGKTVFTVGLDSLMMGKDPVFKGKLFASSDQTLWSFPKRTAGKYSRNSIEQTTDNLISVKDARFVHLAFKHITSLAE